MHPRLQDEATHDSIFQGISTSYSTLYLLDHVRVNTTVSVAADTVSFEKRPVRITAGTFPIPAQVFVVFLHATAGIIPRLGYDCFLPNPTKFIIYQPTYQSTLRSLRHLPKTCTYHKLIIMFLVYNSHHSDAEILLAQESPFHRP